MTSNRHRLLNRQIRQATNSAGQLDLEQLLDLVSGAYSESDEDRIRTDRSITLMIEELDAANSHAHENHNRRFEAAIGHMSQGFAIFDAEHRLIACNGAFAWLYGLPSETEAKGLLFWDILDRGNVNTFSTPEERSETHAFILGLIENRTPWRGIQQVAGERFISTIHDPLPDGGWITIQEDVTQRRLRESQEMARLRDAEAQTMRFNAAIDNMNHGLSMFDADRNLVVCNKSFAQLYRLPETLVQPGTPFREIFRHRESMGLIDKNPDGAGAWQTLSDLISRRGASHHAVEMVSGQVIMVNHQPLADGGWLSTHEDITQQHRNAETIRYMARHDSLTGLSNRVTFLDAMAETEKRIEIGEVLAVMCIDLDRFKEINDSLGHAVGDAVLTEVSGRLLSVLEGRGITARLGGDEFAALVGPLDSENDALDIAESLIQAMKEPFIVGNSRITCGASIGIAMAPEHGHDSQVLMRCADLALYRAKSETPGGYRLFESRMDVAQRRRQSIETGLRDAAQDGSISLMFQPLVSLESGRVACCEALMRWQSPELGMVSPAEFITVAEETGLINELGVWALETACNEATNWPCHVRVSVNVSPVQFRGDTLVEQVRRALAISGLEPSRLELEITESLFLDDDAHNLEVLHQLRQLGVRFALDDFGTGYSSLAYMLRFPFDKVKIDRAIVSTIAEKPETVAMVTAIVDLCRGFDMLTVAEGIETEEQLAEVQAHGCDEVQGYVFSPPLPQSAIGELLRRKRIKAHPGEMPAPYARWA